MLPVPCDKMNRYEDILRKRGVDIARFADYKKWLRYFIDFCSKYSVTGSIPERIRLFLEKLRSKSQSEMQCRQAAHAISLYFEMQNQEVPQCNPNNQSNQLQKPKVTLELATPVSTSSAPAEQLSAYNRRPSQYSAAGYQEKSSSPEWDEVIGKLADEIKVRHYSRKTLKTYALWSRQFQRFLKNKPPQELSSADVKEYLTFLAVKCNVAASTQNQAFNALLFLYRHALKKDFGRHTDIPRAKKSLYIPMVLSMEEIEAIVAQLYYPYNLFVQVLFGCGLRLFECLQIRVGDFNFAVGTLLAHGKGKKDRTVPIPELITPELKEQIRMVGELHEQDLAAGYAGVFLDDDIEKKYPKAPKEFRDSEIANIPFMHLIFRPSLPPLQSQNPQRSHATPAVLLNQ